MQGPPREPTAPAEVAAPIRLTDLADGSMSLRRCWQFPATPAAVSTARRAAAGMVSDALPALTDDIRLVVSELATNAVVHAGTAFTLDVELFPTWVRVEVADGSPELPQPRTAVPDAASGRGCAIIEYLARAWGAHPSEHGKVVWAELTIDRPY